MSEVFSDLRRVASTSGLYAAGQLLTRGLAFFLLPVYTRVLERSSFGALELLNTLSAILLAFVTLGMPSALNKCFHRDCRTDDDKATILSTALMLVLPVQIVGALLLFAFAEPLGRWIIGTGGNGDLIRLVAATTVSSSMLAIVLASFRTRERALTYVWLNLLQFVPAMLFNITLVVVFKFGIRGVLWGNLASILIALPVGLLVSRRDSIARFNRDLVRPLLHFGMLIVPVTLAGWVINVSDRYVLRAFEDLDQVAIYGVGYKIGMVMELAIVWPFQLAWPAVSFAISSRSGYQRSYARVTTYLLLIMVAAFLGLSLMSRAGLATLVGEGYERAYTIVPWVALAYLFNGLCFCVSPGIHIAKKTKYLTQFAVLAAGLNLALNFWLVPRFGFIGAAWSTALTFFALALATWWTSQHFHPVRYEYGRLVKIAVSGGLVYAVAVLLEPSNWPWALAWQASWVLVGFPLLLIASGFLDAGERAAVRQLANRLPRILRRR